MVLLPYTPQIIRYKKAKAEGILNTSAETADDKLVVAFLAIQFIACAILAGAYFTWYWNVAVFGMILAIINYIYIAYSKFGGVTGDLAGWFLCRAEVIMAVVITLFSIVRGRV